MLPAGRAGRLAGAARDVAQGAATSVESGGFGRAVYGALAVLLAYLAVDEAFLSAPRDAAQRSGSAVGTVVSLAPSTEVGGTVNINLSFKAADGATYPFAGINVDPPPGGTPSAGNPWPTPIRYSAAGRRGRRPADRTRRTPRATPRCGRPTCSGTTLPGSPPFRSPCSSTCLCLPGRVRRRTGKQATRTKTGRRTMRPGIRF